MNMNPDQVTEESIREQMMRKARISIWKKAMIREMDMVYTVFTEKRADAIMLAAERLKHLGGGSVGSIQSIDLCVQIEEEFPGRVQEFVEEAYKHPDGMLVGLGQYIKYQRG